MAARTSPGDCARGAVRFSAVWLCLTAGLFVLGCDLPQSALNPAGVDAARVTELWVWMAAGAALAWTAVVGLLVWAAYGRRSNPMSPSGAIRLVIVGGAVIPTVVLTGLLVYGLAGTREMLEPAPDGGLVVQVTGEEWWWRVRYVLPSGEVIESANEIRLPVGRRVNLELRSADVVHSLWIPALGGKMDMIPGRTTRLSLEPTRAGTWRGACAEFCGMSHAAMGLVAVTMEPDSFRAWLDDRSAPASAPATSASMRGHDVFENHGCGACHTVRGTQAAGRLGPDLTHVGARRTVGDGSLPNDTTGFARWLSGTDRIKPGVRMPHFGMLSRRDLSDLSAYLDALR